MSTSRKVTQKLSQSPMATRLLSLGLVLLLLAAAAAAFGLPRGVTSAQCAYQAQQYDAISPFSTGNTTAIHIGNTQSCIAGYGGRQDPETTYQFCIPSWVTFTDKGTFGDERRNFMSGAGRSYRGFRVAKVVDQQVAAAAAYGLHENGDGKVIFVFHLGGRTSHATKFRFHDGTAHLLDKEHDAYFGGDDFTGRIVDHFVELIKDKHGRNIRHDESALRKLRAECESAKKALSDREDTLVSVESLVDGMNFSAALTRAKFEELTRDLMAKAMHMVDTVVMGRGPHKDAIDEIILVGGSGRIPKVDQLLRDYFHGRELLIRDEEGAVIRGAAIISRPESVKYVE